MSGRISTPRRRGRWYVAVVLAIVVVLGRSAADDDRHRRRATTTDICQRDPPDIRVDSMPGDHEFRIQIVGHAVRYTPGQVYTGASFDRCLVHFTVSVESNWKKTDAILSTGNRQKMNCRLSVGNRKCRLNVSLLLVTSAS